MLPVGQGVTPGTAGFDIGVWGEHRGSCGIHILKQAHELPPAERAVEEALSIVSELCRDSSDARSDLSLHVKVSRGLRRRRVCASHDRVLALASGKRVCYLFEL